MTTLLDAPVDATGPQEDRPARPRAGALLEHAAAVALLLWWAGPMTTRTGGRGPGATAVAVVLAAALFGLSSPWRRLGRGSLLLALLVPAGALVVCLTAPTGWYGADDLASYTLAALSVPAMAAYARTSVRRTAVVAAVCLAGLAEFAQAFLPWWGGENPAQAMIGTFYWWNPFAAFLLPGALLGVALAVRGERPWRLVGWAAAPLCAAGIVFSSSRTTLALAVLGTGALLLLCLDRQAWRGRLLRWALVVALSFGAVVGLSGPPFFPDRAGVSAAADAKAARGETVERNGQYRLEFWTRAVAVLRDRPLVGSGPHALVGASDPLVKPGLARSNLAHNGYLQALSDGGLVLGLPFLLACAGCLVAAGRRLLSARPEDTESWLRIALPVALAASAAHSAVDFDWSHSSDLLLTALLAGLVVALPVRDRSRPRRSTPAWPVLLAVAGLAAVAATASWHWDDTALDVGRVTGSPAERAAALHRTGSEPLRDHRWAVGVLRLAAGSQGPVEPHGVASADLRWAVERTSAIAAVDPDVLVLRARGLVVLGDRAAAAEAVTGLLTRLGPQRSGGVADYASQVLAGSGHRDEARRLVLWYLLTDPTDQHAGSHLAALLDVDTGRYDEVDRCAYAAVPAGGRLPATPDPGTPLVGTTCASTLQGALS